MDTNIYISNIFVDTIFWALKKTTLKLFTELEEKYDIWSSLDNSITDGNNTVKIHWLPHFFPYKKFFNRDIKEINSQMQIYLPETWRSWIHMAWGHLKSPELLPK